MTDSQPKIPAANVSGTSETVTPAAAAATAVPEKPENNKNPEEPADINEKLGPMIKATGKNLLPVTLIGAFIVVLIVVLLMVLSVTKIEQPGKTSPTVQPTAAPTGAETEPAGAAVTSLPSAYFLKNFGEFKLTDFDPSLFNNGYGVDDSLLVRTYKDLIFIKNSWQNLAVFTDKGKLVYLYNKNNPQCRMENLDFAINGDSMFLTCKSGKIGEEIKGEEGYKIIELNLATGNVIRSWDKASGLPGTFNLDMQMFQGELWLASSGGFAKINLQDGKVTALPINAKYQDGYLHTNGTQMFASVSQLGVAYWDGSKWLYTPAATLDPSFTNLLTENFNFQNNTANFVHSAQGFDAYYQFKFNSTTKNWDKTKIADNYDEFLPIQQDTLLPAVLADSHLVFNSSKQMLEYTAEGKTVPLPYRKFNSVITIAQYQNKFYLFHDAGVTLLDSASFKYTDLATFSVQNEAGANTFRPYLVDEAGGNIYALSTNFCIGDCESDIRDARLIAFNVQSNSVKIYQLTPDLASEILTDLTITKKGNSVTINSSASKKSWSVTVN